MKVLSRDDVTRPQDVGDLRASRQWWHPSFDAFATRLARLGARGIWRGEHWFWGLKPDYKPGEVFEL